MAAAGPTDSWQATSYLVVSDNGDALLVAPTDDPYHDVATLVDGDIECISLAGQLGWVYAWVNEEGLWRRDFGENLAGSVVVLQKSGRPCRLVGPVVFAGHDGKGGTLPCPAWFIDEVRNGGLELVDGTLSVAECAARMAESRRIRTEAQA